MKAYLDFNKFSVRELKKVQTETDIVVMELNVLKLSTLRKNQTKNGEKNLFGFSLHFHLLETTFVVASVFYINFKSRNSK